MHAMLSAEAGRILGAADFKHIAQGLRLVSGSYAVVPDGLLPIWRHTCPSHTPWSRQPTNSTQRGPSRPVASYPDRALPLVTTAGSHTDSSRPQAMIYAWEPLSGLHVESRGTPTMA
jgi:hypothetical protein